MIDDQKSDLLINDKKLNLKNQNINDISSILLKINSNYLVDINLSHNKIHQLKSDQFIDLKSLKYLNLSHNQIQSLDQLNLTNSFELIELDVSYNQISHLSADLFHACLKNLKKIDLSYNEIANLPSGLFKNINRSIETIKLTRNRISHLDSSLFMGLESLKYLYLSNNKINISYY